MKLMRPTTTLFLLVALGLMSMSSGCATRSGTLQAYSGPELTEDQTATLKAAERYILSGTRVFIEQVDEQAVAPHLEAAVLPGKHSVVIEYSASHGNSPVTRQRVVFFVAAAGHTYVADATEKLFSFKTWFWIEDERTGEVVGGERP